MQKSRTGFTIIELLVVIVVIALLAAVSIVAYVGIQDRARNTALLSGMDAVEKALQLYATANGSYPKPTDLPGQSGQGNGYYSYACIQPTATGWPARGGLTSSQCWLSAGSQPSYAGYSTVVQQALLSQVSAIPDTSNFITQYDASTSFRGIIYQYFSDPTAALPRGQVVLFYLIKGDQACGRGQKAVIGPMTQCAIVLQ